MDTSLRVPFKCMSTNPEPTHTLKNPLVWALTELSYLGPLFPCPNHTRSRYQKTRDSPYTQDPGEFIQTSQILNKLTPLHLFLPTKNTTEALTKFLSHSLCLLPCPGASLCGPAWHGVLSSLGNNSNHLLICWLHQT